MTRGLSDQWLSQLSKSIADQAGLYFPPERWSDLERGIQSAAPLLGCRDAASCAQLLLSEPLKKEQIEILATALTVGETYFFREKRSFEILSEQILPELIRARQGSDRRLRIWSAGCCTGEEPYSIAILLDRILPDLRQWHVTILATDVNPNFLKKASIGVFSEWSFRNPPTWLKDNYFRQVDKNHFEILPRIKERVTFAYLNLAEDIYPSLTNNTNAMDLIFCRNVLMYFAAETVKKAAHNFHRSLVDKGWLLISPTELSSELFPQFSSVHFEGAILYQKGEKVSPVPVIPLPQPVLDFIPPLPEPIPVLEAKMERPQPTLYERALTLLEGGDATQAIEKLEEDFARTSSAESAALLARTYANLGELAEARSWVEKAIGANKLHAGWHYLRAIILQEQGADEEGSAALKRALYLDSDFVLAHFALGNLALRQGHSKEAHKHFLNVLELLADYQPDEMLPQSDGLVGGRLKEMVISAMSMERAA